MDRSILVKLRKGLKSPRQGYRYIKSLLNGYKYKAWYRLFCKNVQIGSNFRVYSTIEIKGPGRVVIGNDVVVSGRVTPWTYSPGAEILIGDGVFLNGTRLGCASEIKIGDNCILADCRILDTDFHSVNPGKRNDPGYVKSAPINVGNDVWIAMGCMVLRGVTIGDGATIAAGSVLTSDVEPESVFGGNPAVFISRLNA